MQIRKHQLDRGGAPIATGLMKFYGTPRMIISLFWAPGPLNPSPIPLGRKLRWGLTSTLTSCEAEGARPLRPRDKPRRYVQNNFRVSCGCPRSNPRHCLLLWLSHPLHCCRWLHFFCILRARLRRLRPADPDAGHHEGPRLREVAVERRNYCALSLAPAPSCAPLLHASGQHTMVLA